MHIFLTLNNTIYQVRSKVLGQLFLYFENMKVELLLLNAEGGGMVSVYLSLHELGGSVV